MIEDRQPDYNDDPSNPFGGYRFDGTYWCGPAGMRCVLAILIANSIVRVVGRTAYGERRAWIHDRAEHMRRTYTEAELRELEAARRKPTVARIGRFYAPLKPATSGRKRKVA